MPLRQTLLDFQPRSSLAQAMERGSISAGKPELRRSVSMASSEVDGDTIVVDISDRHPQLPTPSDSATDASSQSSQVVRVKQVPKGRPKRVSRGLAMAHSHNALLDSVEDESGNNRTVSGETLVNPGNASQSSLVREGIAALDLPWNMSNVFAKGSKGEFFPRANLEKNDSVESLITVNVEVQEVDTERAAAQKANMEENARRRQEKWKAADEKATRRSSRVSMLGKAGGFVSGLAANVLGKRKNRLAERTAHLRPRSMAEPLPGFGTDSKKRRVSEGDLATERSPRTSCIARHEKKWLASGLYAGQSRTTDSRLTDNNNKRKSVPQEMEVERENTVMPLPMFAGQRLLTQGRDFKLPFDVFSPLPPGQPKPDEWRKTNKNVFVGDAAQGWRTSKFEGDSTCMCKPDTGCDHNCMNRFMYYECDSRNCNLTEEQCGNRPFEGLRQRIKKGGKYNIGVEVIKTVDRGYGVRSNRTFEPNQIIVEYTGEIITQEECESRMRTIYKDNECYYLMLFDQNMIIDATRGSIARFVNHSCEPNCRMEKWTVAGKPRMALFAGDHGIVTGEELTYDYNFDPYSQKNVQQCRCGAKNCRGILGPRTMEEKKQKNPGDEKKVREGRMAGAKRKIAEVFEESTSRLNKKRKVAAVQARVYGPAGSSPLKVKGAKLSKKAVVRKRNVSASAALHRRPSKLNRMIAGAKGKATGKRITSTSSAADALIVARRENPLRRTSSLKARASSLRKNVVQTVRGAQHGRQRSIRPVMDGVER